jgi:hypothetical protein
MAVHDVVEAGKRGYHQLLGSGAFVYMGAIVSLTHRLVLVLCPSRLHSWSPRSNDLLVLCVGGILCELRGLEYCKLGEMQAIERHIGAMCSV